MEINKGFKQTEIGILPDDWKVKSCDQIASPVRGGSPRPAGDPRYFNGSYIPWLTVASLTNISESQITVDKTEGFLTELGAKYSRTLERGTLIIANSGATLGVAKILGVKCCANDGIAALLGLERQVDPYYLTHYINTKTKYLRDVVATGNGQPNLNTNLIGNFKIPLPPTKLEQETIAKALSDADAYIESLEKLIEKKCLIKKGVMFELLTGKRRLSGFTKNWEDVVLGDQANFYKGKGLPKSALAESGKYPCIHYGELFTQYKEVIKSFRSRTDQSGDTFLSQVNDVLMPTSDVTPKGLAKASCITQENVILGGDILVIRTSKKLSGSFLSYIIRFLDTQILQLVSGTTVFHIYASDMARFKFSMPEIDEQNAIVEILEDFEREIEFLENKLHKAKHIKQGMMAELLTGRIRLV